MSKKTSLLLLAAFILFLFAIGLAIGPIPQPQAYHNFADQRTFFGIPNALNVLSNIPYALAGIWGIFILRNKRQRWQWMGVSIGLILTALGSAYYHLAPDDSRLVVDRLAMIVVFMSLAAALITERLWLWPVLLAIGFYSVFYWYTSDDLRLYLGLQIFTAFVVLLSGNFLVLSLFILAFLFETYDLKVAMFTGNWISGHTLKHLAGGIAALWLMRMLWKRKKV